MGVFGRLNRAEGPGPAAEMVQICSGPAPG